MRMAFFGEDTLRSLLESFSGIYTDFTVAAILLLFGIAAGKLLGKLSLRLLHELELNRLVKGLTRKGLPLEEIISSGLTYLVYLIFVVVAMERLGLNPYLFNIIALAVMAVLVVSVLLAIKDFIPNIIAGLAIHLTDRLREGDTIAVDGMDGRVVQVGVVETRLETRGGDTIYVPNSLLTKSVVKRRARK